MTEEAAGTGRLEPIRRQPQHVGDDQPSGVSRLRPYLVTAGRSRPIDDTLEIEAQVASTQLGVASYSRLAFEHRDIVALCKAFKSMAEIGAGLGLHIGVVRVLVADLAALGYLVVRRPNPHLAQDVDIIERIIRGLEAIH